MNCSQRACLPIMYEREYDDLESGDFEADEPPEPDEPPYDTYEFMDDSDPYGYVDDRDEPDYDPPAASGSGRDRIPRSLDTSNPVRPQRPELPDSPSAGIEDRPRDSLIRRIRRWLVGTKSR